MKWQTRTLATFIAATVPVERGKGNPLLDAAHQVGMEPERSDQGSTEPTRAEPQPGSFEAFMGAFAARPGGLHR